MAEPTPLRGPPPGGAPAHAVTPDETTAAILAKHTAGVQLTSSEGGKLGAWKKKLKSLLPGASVPPVAKSAVVPATGPLAVGGGGPAAAPADGLDVIPFDPLVAQRTAAAILRRADAITVRYLERAATEAGATGATLERFRAAGSLPPDDRALICDLAPDAMRELGLDPRSSPLFTISAVLGLHVTNLWLAIDELKKMRAPAPPPPPPPKPAVPATTTTPPAPTTPNLSGKPADGTPG